MTNVLVGLGCPRQEVFTHAMRPLLDMPLLAVGAAFDYHAGLLRKPPAWMQKYSLEWLWRLGLEPARPFVGADRARHHVRAELGHQFPFNRRQISMLRPSASCASSGSSMRNRGRANDSNRPITARAPERRAVGRCREAAVLPTAQLPEAAYHRDAGIDRLRAKSPISAPRRAHRHRQRPVSDPMRRRNAWSRSRAPDPPSRNE